MGIFTQVLSAQYIVSTVAGGAFPPAGASALATGIPQSPYMAVDGFGNQYVTFQTGVSKVSTNGLISKVAGSGGTGFSGDTGPALNAEFNNLQAIAVDPAGNLYVADINNYRIRKIAPSGIVTTIAGNGSPGSSGDGGPAVMAEIGIVTALAVDSAGSIYIADTTSFRIREVSAFDGTIRTIAGTGTNGYSGDGGPPASAEISGASALVVDPAGNVYIADALNYRIRFASVAATMSTIAGTGVNGYSGDGGQATLAEIAAVGGMALDTNGNIYITDPVDSVVREFSAEGNISTVAQTSVGIDQPEGLGVDASANVYFSELIQAPVNGALVIREFTAGGAISTTAGNGSWGYFGDSGPADYAGLGGPDAVAVDPTGNLYILDTGDSRVREVQLNGQMSTVAGNGIPGYLGDGGAASGAEFNYPEGMAVDSSGNLYIADTNNCRVREVTAGGTVFTMAGSASCGYSGDGGSATAAEINSPTAVAVDSVGNVFIADTDNNVIRKVATNGIITTFAGNHTPGYSGDGGPATMAELFEPNEVAVDAAGNVYIADQFNYRIREVTASMNITTIAGNGTSGYTGDGGLAIDAEINVLYGLVVDPKGNVYLSDSINERIREISGGAITTIAGNGSYGYSGDGGPAQNAAFNTPWGLATDAHGNVYVADSLNNAIRELIPQNGSALLTLTSTHTGNFSAGESAANYSLQVTNNALAGPTSGIVTLSETVPTGMSLVSMSGSGWSCTGNDCSRNDALSGGSGYPPITVAVDVAANAPATIINQATVTGGGSFAASAEDVTEVTCVVASPTAVQVDISGGGPQTVALMAASPSCSWIAVSNANWMQVAPLSGAGSATLTITIPQNQTNADRTGSIVIGTAAIAVSQAFTAQAFNDVTPNDYYFDASNLFVQEGITNGCSSNPLDYCPTQPVTRAQMAIFIVRSVYGGDNFTPNSLVPYFNDVPVGSFGFNWIQKMYELGITTGCGNNGFCPDDSVTRAQMAVFIIRARYGSTASFSVPLIPYFTDVPPGAFGYEWIQRMRYDNITSGCGATTYCPTNSVTRGDMAVFVMRGLFNQLVTEGTPEILSISPDSIAVDQAPTVTIYGINTHFDSTTTVNPIPGVVLGTSVTVNSPISITLSISPNADADTTQPYSIFVTTADQNEEEVLPNGLTLTSPQ